MDLFATDIDDVIEEVLGFVQRNTTSEYMFYFSGWRGGYGATAFLSYMARVLASMKDPPPGRHFGRIIYLDCSVWESKRAMQRKLAEELKLDRKTMAMFEEQDEEDDFYGVDRASRDVIRNVARVIDQTLGGSRFMVIFINGSDDEIVLGPFGISEYYHDHVVLWTFTSSTYAEKIRHTKTWLRSTRRLYNLYNLSSPQLSALLLEEAATLTCQRDIDPAMAIDCLFYRSFLKESRDITYQFIVREKHDPSSMWICDGAIQGDRAREISKVLLHPEIDDRYLQADRIISYLSRKIPYRIVKDGELTHAYKKRPYRWIAIKLKNNITSKVNNKVQEDLQTTLAGASSIILGSGCSDESPHVLLPNGLFQQCNNLCMLILSRCSFSFVSPPFSQCHTLRYLGLDHCTDDDGTSSQLEGENNRITKWACLYSLLVLDLYYTEWGEILSEEKVELMANLTELNIEGVWCLQWTSHLEKRLPYLQRLRIIKPPVRQAQTSPSDIISNSLIDKTELEVLDLSGNIRMENLPTSLSKVIKLHELILDGCVVLEKVVLANPSLKSFSFDCSKHHVDDAGQEKYAKISMISLQGCTQLEKLILCGLPNLVELDLSGCPIKILDFATMVDVPTLKRLFLLGCEHLRAIGNWSWFQGLLCIDTRPARMLGCTRPSIDQLEGFELIVHAIITDARLVRSLQRKIYDHERRDVYFNINITSSTTARTSKEMIGSSDEQHHDVPGLYDDVLSKVGGDSIPMRAFPLPPTLQSDCHVEIGDGGHNVQSEVEASGNVNLGGLLAVGTESLHVHDALARTIIPAKLLWSLRWCRVERCPNLEAVFPSGAVENNNTLETVWASDLLKARCIWSKFGRDTPYWLPQRRASAHNFQCLQHLHLRSCPSLQYALPVWFSSFPSLETLHISHCGSLRHVFEQDEVLEHRSSVVEFPKLATIHLHDVPALQQICEAAEMPAPALETMRIRGCWSLRRLPALKGRQPGTRRPAVEVEKEVWDALEWDGVDAGHHPSLYATPVHARYYKKRGLLRGTVLR